MKALLIVLFVATNPLPAQEARDPYRPIRSLGLPPHLAAFGGLAAVGGFDGPFAAGGRVFAGVRHELIRPAMGILGVAAEGYGGVVGGEFEGGARIYGTVRAFLLQAGVEFASSRPGVPLFTMAVEDPLVRGGVVAPGGLLRLEWTPATHRLGLGVSLPLFQPMAGRTRPTVTVVSPPPTGPPRRVPPVPDSVAEVLRALRASATWIDEMTTPFLSASLKTDREFQAQLAAQVAFIRETDAAHPDGHGYLAEVDAYHRLLRGLLASAAGDAGATVLDVAREVVLDEVLFPANRHFGMVRKPEVFAAYLDRATRRFSAELESVDGLSADRRVTVEAAFAGWLDVISAVERQAGKRWRDSRLAWLPFQLVLAPDAHDTQAEIDRLIERLLERQFDSRNDFAYLINEAFSPELIRSIHAAADYHVLWVHDFAGTGPDGRVDRVAGRVMVEGYLDALTERVRMFDRTGRLPAFMIFLDQWYFDFRHARWWMAVLADPLGQPIRLPAEAAELQERVRAAQTDLRRAVDASVGMQRLRRERGADWLRKYVKVHVSVTYPGDPSFRRRIPASATPMRFADDYMRDHRKVAFWDLSERDPARGGALFTGEGVGENYEGARWEDRTLLVRGVAALPLKAAARQLLLEHGVEEGDLPFPLLPDSTHHGALPTDSLWADWTTRLMQVSNATGYGPKDASVLKAALYNLLPAGSRIMAPDSQWSSFFWAGMLAGSALRGCQVFVIAPRSLNAPYGEAFVQTVLTHDVLEGYLQLRSALGEMFRASGGGLYVGLYGQDVGTRSLRERYLGVIAGLSRPSFPRAAFPFPAETWRQLSDIETLEGLLAPIRGLSRVEPAPPSPPRLHLKSQLFASGEGLDRVLRDPGWFRVFVRYVGQRAQEFSQDQTQAAGGRMSPALLADIDSTLRRAPPGERSRDVFYLLTGSQNQNDRSLLLDGEILCLVAGVEALASLIDFVAIAARSEWVETLAGLDSLISRQPRDKVKVARSLRSLF